jgi:hypothetical protein
MTMLPSTTMPYSAVGISLYLRKAHFGLTGWQGQAPVRPPGAPA